MNTKRDFARYCLMFVVYVLFATGVYASADAENGTTTGWTEVDGAVVKNITDPQDNNRVYSIKGLGVYGKYWKYGESLEGGKSVSFDVRSDGGTFTVWIDVKTDKGVKKVTLYPSYSPKMRLDYRGGVMIAGSLSLKDGNWHHIEYDLQSLFAQAGSDATVLGVEGVSFRGYRGTTLYVDNISAGETQPPADTTAPLITLNGDNPLILTTGDTYTEAGATATDDVDGAVAVSVSGNVDTTTEGNYTVVYSATDSAGNGASVTRTVIVETSIAMPDDPSIISILQALQPGQGIRLPNFTITAPYGGLDAFETFATDGPGIRDYSMKWVYANDRGSALYAGANHGAPHKFDDVWEYFLGANTWVLLHAPDSDAQPLHTWWGLTYDSKHGRLYWMAPQSAVSSWPLINANPNPPLVYFEPNSPLDGWQYLPTSTTFNPGYAAALEYIPDTGSLLLWSKAWNGAGLQQLDLNTSVWNELISHEEAYFQNRDDSPHPEALVGYNTRDHTLVGFVDKDVFTYSFGTNKWSKTGSDILPVNVKDNTSSISYDPQRNLYFLVSSGHLFTFNPATNAVEDITPANFPAASHLSMPYIDQRLDLVVVYEKHSQNIFVYRP